MLRRGEALCLPWLDTSVGHQGWRPPLLALPASKQPLQGNTCCPEDMSASQVMWQAHLRGRLLPCPHAAVIDQVLPRRPRARGATARIQQAWPREGKPLRC